MKKRATKNIPWAAVAILGCALALWSPLADASPPERPNRSLVGSWDITIQPDGGVPAPGLATYSADGGLTNSSTPPPGLTVSSGHGVWKRTGSRSFALIFKLFQLRPDGTLDSTLKVTERLVMNRSFTEYQGKATLELLFPGGGSFVIPGVFATRGTRIRIVE